MSKEEKESYIKTISLNNTQEVKDNYSYNYNAFINTDAWKTNNIVINDNLETLIIHYKGVDYKFNLQKVLDRLADIVEEAVIVNK